MKKNQMLKTNLSLNKVENKLSQYEKELIKMWLEDIMSMQKISSKIKGIYVLTNNQDASGKLDFRFDVEGWNNPLDSAYFITHIQIKPGHSENKNFENILQANHDLLNKYNSPIIKAILHQYFTKTAKVNGMGNHVFYVNANDLNKTYEEVFGQSFIIEEEKKQLDSTISKTNTKKSNKIKV